jgi:hypothetical protein
MVLELSRPATPLDWLQGEAVARSDGAVMSWVNPGHPGYPYPEIAGYLLSYLARHGRQTMDVRNRVADRLLDDMSTRGAVGRAGVEYVFDTAMVLAGVLAHRATGGVLPDRTMPHRLRDYIVATLSERRAFDGSAPAAPDHWSVSYGCHLLKCVIALLGYHDDHPDPRTTAVVGQLLDELLELHDGERFRSNALTHTTYTHAHCYAVEGLLVLDGRGQHGLRPWIERSAEWLAKIQQPDGGVPSGHDGSAAIGAAHADCTAQAVRIWACVSAQRYARPIERGLEFLGSLSVDGGIRYRVGSDDVNTWATIFGAQAFEFAGLGGEWRWII